MVIRSTGADFVRSAKFRSARNREVGGDPIGDEPLNIRRRARQRSPHMPSFRVESGSLWIPAVKENINIFERLKLITLAVNEEHRDRRKIHKPECL